MNLNKTNNNDKFVYYDNSLLLSILEKREQNSSTDALLKRNQEAKQSYYVDVGGNRFIVCPNVFSPSVFGCTDFFLKKFKDYSCKRFLEIGCGTGVISVNMALRGAEVVCVDINPYAVENTRENARIHGVEDRVTVCQGDVFDPIAEGEKFDAIFWAAPTSYKKDKRDFTLLERAAYDPGYNGLHRYLCEGWKYLNVDGDFFLGFSKSHGHYSILESFSGECNIVPTLVSEDVINEGIDFQLQLFRLDYLSYKVSVCCNGVCVPFFVPVCCDSTLPQHSFYRSIVNMAKEDSEKDPLLVAMS